MTASEAGRDASSWARELGISSEAVALHAASDVIDLHVDTFIWTRLLGYDLRKRHGRGPLRACFLGQADLPRLVSAGVTGATWVITTNPFRTARGREHAFFRNLARLESLLDGASTPCERVRTAAEYRAARKKGRHAAFVGVQGGNALDHDLTAFDRLPDRALLRVTLVHLTSSRLGRTSSPLGLRRKSGLTSHGKSYVQTLNSKRIFVDLAHIDRAGFWDALSVHDRSQPLLVTHTGVNGVHRHWRNLDDDQIRAVADTGGVVGIMYQSQFLEGKVFGKLRAIADHLDHVRNVAGADAPALGSDWDGAIITPRDMATCSELPRLVQELLDRRWPHEDIQKALGRNFLRALESLRG